ncbi:hypothetical protein ES703_19096 [subsurface metagenome]
MAQDPITQPLRLIVQASIPIETHIQGELEYDNLKIFLLAISPEITLNGQVIKRLEPCCKKKQETKDHEESP